VRDARRPALAESKGAPPTLTSATISPYGARAMPLSVTIAVTYFDGVTSMPDCPTSTPSAPSAGPQCRDFPAVALFDGNPTAVSGFEFYPVEKGGPHKRGCHVPWPAPPAYRFQSVSHVTVGAMRSRLPRCIEFFLASSWRRHVIGETVVGIPSFFSSHAVKREPQEGRVSSA